MFLSMFLIYMDKIPDKIPDYIPDKAQITKIPLSFLQVSRNKRGTVILK